MNTAGEVKAYAMLNGISCQLEHPNQFAGFWIYPYINGPNALQIYIGLYSSYFNGSFFYNSERLF